MNELISKRISSIIKFVESNGYESFDPYDGLLSPISKIVTFNNKLLMRIWQQSILLFPFNIRSFVFIKKFLHTKTISDFASGFALTYSISKNEKDKERAIKMLEELVRRAMNQEHGISWGLNFNFATRFIKANSKSCNIYQSINAINALLDGYEYLNSQNSLIKALEGFKSIEKDLGYNELEVGIYWYYWKNMKEPIFNVNGLMVGLCSRLYKITKLDKYKSYTQKTYNYLIKNQNSDGSWYYSKSEKARFIDGFHTGFIIEGLSRAVIHDVTVLDDNLRAAIKFYLNNFFTKDYLPKYYHNSQNPLDAQNIAQALQTLYFINKLKLIESDFIENVFKKVDQVFWNEKGYYNFKKSQFLFYKEPMHRWATGPMFLSLNYLKKITL